MKLIKQSNVKTLKFLIPVILFLIIILNCASAKDYKIPEGSKKSEIKDIGYLEKLQEGLSEIAEKAAPAVVFISVSKTVKVPRLPFSFPFEDFFGFRFPQPGDQNGKGEKEFQQRGAGSGFIITLTSP